MLKSDVETESLTQSLFIAQVTEVKGESVEEAPLSAAEWGCINTVLYAQNDPTQIRQAIQSFPQMEDADEQDIAKQLFQLGEKLLDLKKFTKSHRIFSATLAMDPTLVEAHIRLAETLDWQGKYTLAMEVLEQAQEQFPENSEILKYLTELCEYQGDYQEMGNLYKRILVFHPDDTATYLQLLQHLSDHKMFETLADFANQTLIPQLDPQDNFRALNLLVVAYMETGDYEKALVCADEALLYNPKRIALWEMKVRMYAKLRRREEALQCLRYICQLKPMAKKYATMAQNYAAKHHLE